MSHNEDILNSSEVFGFDSFSKLVENLWKYDWTKGFSNTFVIGGQAIYSQFKCLCDTAYVTKVYGSGVSDRFFPNLDRDSNWVIEDEIFNSDNMTYYKFFKYCRLSCG